MRIAHERDYMLIARVNKLTSHKNVHKSMSVQIQVQVSKII